MSDKRKFYNLFFTAIALLALTFIYMGVQKIPLSRMPILVWVLFGGAILFPLSKALGWGKKKSNNDEKQE